MPDNANPAGWPEELLPVFQRSITCEYASLTRKGEPVTWPLTPFMGEDGRTLDITTGLTYPAKAERARRDPRVSLLFSEPKGSGLSHYPTVLVQGLATVRDADLQAGADRYAKLAMAKLPEAYKSQPKAILRRQSWYFTRIWILVTPLRILWWPNGSLDEQPHIWTAPEGTTAPPSDPAPKGAGPGPWQQYPPAWTQLAKHAATLGAPVLTVVDEAGYPYPLRTGGATLQAEGFSLRIPASAPEKLEGPACLTFHAHAEAFTGQENTSFVGQIRREGSGSAFFTVERALPDFSLPGSKFSVLGAFLSAAVKLAPRLKAEAARRGQRVPTVHI